MLSSARPASIFNDVIGPVMRGPSSSHTAGAYHIARVAMSLLGESPDRAAVTVDHDGSYAVCFAEQGADLAFASALLDRSLTDARYFSGPSDLAAAGIRFSFAVAPLDRPEHPNDMLVELGAGSTAISLRAQSIGGGAVRITRFGRWPTDIDGASYALLAEVSCLEAERVRDAVALQTRQRTPPVMTPSGDSALVTWLLADPPGQAVLTSLRANAAVRAVWCGSPVFFVLAGDPTFSSAAELAALASGGDGSPGELALEYEAQLLGLGANQIESEAEARFDVMRGSIREGLRRDTPPMQLLGPSAAAIWRADAEGLVAAGGLHTRAAARALAVMHTNGAMGVVCAAPTAGSAGVLPAVLETLTEELGASRHDAVRALLAAGAIGVVIANRATFAAEVAGCQVEIGAAGAMAAAAVVDAAGGTAAQACDAAAIALQNTMGSVCDLVQGVVEIPCHTRNAAAASNAFLCADIVLGGYRNPIPLDETIDAMLAVGKMLPCELRCTARGGLAATPSALAMTLGRLRGGSQRSC